MWLHGVARLLCKLFAQLTTIYKQHEITATGVVVCVNLSNFYGNRAIPLSIAFSYGERFFDTHLPP
jgi:hypothetical protein